MRLSKRTVSFPGLRWARGKWVVAPASSTDETAFDHSSTDDPAAFTLKSPYALAQLKLDPCVVSEGGGQRAPRPLPSGPVCGEKAS